MDLTSLVIRTLQDIISIPGYRERVDPEREPLKRIVKHYHLHHETPCGLSNCRQGHNDGYIVELESGGYTNVGHICARRFGDKFFAEERAYQEKIRRPQLIRKLSVEKRRAEQVQPAVYELSDRLRTLLRRSREFRSRFPNLASEVCRRAGERDVEVFDVEERPEQQIEDILAMNPRQTRDALRYKQVSRGRVRGLGFFTASRWGILALSNEIETFLHLEALHTLSTEKLGEWEQWLNNLDEVVENGRRAIKEGEDFFVGENFALLALIAGSPKEKEDILKLRPEEIDGRKTDEPLPRTVLRKRARGWQRGYRR